MRSAYFAKILAATALAAALAAPPATAAQRPAPPVGIYRSADPGSVNTYWIRAPRGLIIVDAGRALSDAREALTSIQAEHRPVAAILITHAHPDHVGGLAVLHAAFPSAPIIASAATRRIIATDPVGGFAQTRAALGADYATTIPLPDRILRAGETLHLAGLTVRTAEAGPGEIEAQTLYRVPSMGAVFGGDVTADRATPFMLDGRTCGWLHDLDTFDGLARPGDLAFPGHGRVVSAGAASAATRGYLRQFRARVALRVAAGSRGGRSVTPAERAAVVAATRRDHPGELSVAATIPDLIARNVDAVARELRATPVCGAR